MNMNKQELLSKMKKIDTNLENARRELNSANEILNSSITFNGEGLKDNTILEVKNKLDIQINNLNNRIIPSIRSFTEEEDIVTKVSTTSIKPVTTTVKKSSVKNTKNNKKIDRYFR